MSEKNKPNKQGQQTEANKNKEVQENLTPVPLSVMTGQGKTFLAQGKEYIIMPLKLKDVSPFLEDQIAIGSQIFNLSTPEAREKTDRWVRKTLYKGDKQTTLDMLMEDDWDVTDLKMFWRELLEISG